MGDQQINALSAQNKTEFLRRLMSDIDALDYMVQNGLIEKGVTRIGAEQEFCLVHNNLRPAMVGPEVLNSLDEPQFTSELARWNLEINLDPQDAGPGCFDRMSQQLDNLLAIGNRGAQAFNSHILLTGILPTIRKSELRFDCMTPNPRYRVLDESLKELRGEDFLLQLEGVDEINTKHDSILFEACNTSFQVHLQVDPDEFADRYNWAQVLAGPVLAASVNSPLLLGKELWCESRIGLFRQSIETRRIGNYIRDGQPRVAFGNFWLKSSVVEIFKNDVTYYKLIVGADLDEEDPMELVKQGKAPRLQAMNLHNGTLYKWNRACYGVGNGIAHLRIENRYIPAGPTPHDEMANAVFWIGLMYAMPDEYRSAWDKHFRFQEVRANFLKAARNGLANEMRWCGKPTSARNLILDQLLPMAASGLDSLNIPGDEYQPWLDTIRKRVSVNQTGARWMIDSLRKLREKNTLDESILMISEHIKEHCLSNVPVHEWKVPGQTSLVSIPERYDRVDSIMSTHLITVSEDDLIDFAATVMKWNDCRHLPVESAVGELCGIITAKDIERFLGVELLDRPDDETSEALVKDCMTSNVISVKPETSIEQAETLMLKNGIGVMPIVQDHRTVGVITAYDIRELRKKIQTQ